MPGYDKGASLSAHGGNVDSFREYRANARQGMKAQSAIRRGKASRIDERPKTKKGTIRKTPKKAG